MTPVVCANCRIVIRLDPRDFPRPYGWVGPWETTGLCDDCYAKEYKALAGMVLDGDATLVKRERV